MRPRTVDIDPLDVDADGICESQTPAAGGVQSLILNGALCDLGTAAELDIHDAGYSAGIGGVQIVITAAGDDSGRTFTVTGTDQNGNAQTEEITGPNATTVESTKYWRTITGITVDDDTADAITVGTVDECVTRTIPINYRASEPYTVALTSLSGTISVTVQESFEDAMGSTSVDWADAQADKTAETSAALSLHATATRLVVNSYSSGAELQFRVLGN